MKNISDQSITTPNNKLAYENKEESKDSSSKAKKNYFEIYGNEKMLFKKNDDSLSKSTPRSSKFLIFWKFLKYYNLGTEDPFSSPPFGNKSQSPKNPSEKIVLGHRNESLEKEILEKNLMSLDSVIPEDS